MASSLHYVTPLLLSDTFNEWFLRSNDLIDVVNKINVYNVDTGWGLAKYRSIDGTTLIRINVGQAEHEYDGTGVSGDYKYGLRFVDAPDATGGGNPDVASTRKVLTLDFENLPGATGGATTSGQPTGLSVHELDYFAYSDTSSGTGSIRGVQATNILPYTVAGDHRFSGNIYFDGTNTTINSTELNIDDKMIFIACTGGSDATAAGLNDLNLDGAGIVIRGLSGDKEFTYEYTVAAGGGTYHAFKSNIDLLLSSTSKLLSEDKTIEMFGLASDDLDLSMSAVGAEDNFWKIRKSKAGDGQGRLIFFHENTTSGVSSDTMTLSKLGTVKIHQLGGDLGIASGITHESSFKYLPAAYSVPTSGMSGDEHLHYKWTQRKTVYQIAHGFTAGDMIRFYPGGTTYDKAHYTTKEAAEVIAVVEDGNPGGTADKFVAVFGGLVDLSLWNPRPIAGGASGWGSALDGSSGTTMTSGNIYFLDALGNSGGFTSAEPASNGNIRKPVLLSIGEREALFVNYLGNEVSTGDAAGSATGDYVFSDTTGYLITTSLIPSQNYKNKVINGDFSFWQRAEDNRRGTSGASDYVGGGTIGAQFSNLGATAQYTADMWLLDTRPSTSQAQVQKYGHTAGVTELNTSYYSTEPRGSYARVLNNSLVSAGSAKSYFIHRIENVNTLAPEGAWNIEKGQVTLSFYTKGVTAGSMAAMTGMSVEMLQVYDGNSGDAADQFGNWNYGGGATHCLHYNVATGATAGGGSASVGDTWSRKSHTFILNSMSGMTGTTGAYDADNNWLEIRFGIPAQWGPSGGVELARVQLEGGNEATDWDERPIQDEEKLCNRYYQRHFVGAHGYGLAGGTMGVAGQWSTTPYPYYGALNSQWDISVTGKCCWADNGPYTLNTETYSGGATIWDITHASPNRGFIAERLLSGEGSNALYGTYHFDFSIYD